MDSPFFRSRWNAPSSCYSPWVRPVPARSQTVHPSEAASHSPKVVSIPVRFVAPERDLSGSALKIQKVFRGFLVRKSVRRIAALRREVEEIGMRVSDPVAVELIRRDPRERLRVNEMLMNVLFRLDSVRGVDSGVRECRKAVIRRAIALQEKVDEIVAEPAADVDRAEEIEGRADDHAGNAAEEAADDTGTGEPISSFPEAEQPKTAREAEHVDNAHWRVDGTAGEAECSDGADCGHAMINTPAGREEPLMCIGERVEDNDMASSDENAAITAEGSPTSWMNECSGETGMESQTDSSTPQNLIEEVEESADSGAVEEEEENWECDSRKEGEVSAGGGGERRKKEMLEKMMEDNEKMMGMMAELFERNERQTRLLSILSQRVEQLERAFVCEKLRKKKKRLTGGCPADCSETFPDPKKCGKK